MGPSKRGFIMANRTKNIRSVVWNSMLDAERYVRYYGALADTHSKLNTTALSALFVAGSTEAILAALQVHPNYLITVGLLIAGVSMWVRLGNHAEKAAVLYGIRLECNYISQDLRRLWLNVDREGTSDKSILDQNHHLMQRLIASTSRADNIGVAENRKLNEKCWSESCTVLEAEYNYA